jgi:glucose/arabinose dehydrogenase
MRTGINSPMFAENYSVCSISEGKSCRDHLRRTQKWRGVMQLDTLNTMLRLLAVFTFSVLPIAYLNCSSFSSRINQAELAATLAPLAECSLRVGNGTRGSATNTFLVSGDAQSVRVSQPLNNALVMQVTDADGDSIPGVTVEWSVFRGTGRVEQATAVTDVNGCTSARRVVLGTEVGEQMVRAEVPGLAPVYFTFTGLPLESGGIALAEGRFQSATVQTAVADPIVFRVLRGSGEPWSGQSVEFTVASGGGSVEPASAVSDAQGLVRIARWVLGGTIGTQRLRARLASGATIDLEVTAVANGAPVLQVTEFMRGFDRAWDLAFAPSGEIFVTERGGVLSVIRNNQRLVLARPTDVAAQDQSGLLGVAVDPDFATNRFIYTFLSSNRSGQMDNRIRRWRVANDFSSAQEDRDIFVGMAWGAQGAHSGGRVRFGPDGYLYITTGDNRTATIPQDRRRLGGKVIRITRDGAAAPGNPQWAQGERAEIFAYGFRNPQGLTFRPGSGQIFTCEHGPNLNDEVTQVMSGGNGGWDPNDGNGNYDGYTRRDANGVEVGAPSTDTTKFPNALRPTYVVVDSQGMGGCDFLSGSQWGSFNGALAVGLMAGGQIHYVRMNTAGLQTLSTGQPSVNMDRVRTILQGPDGAAYLIIDAAGPNGRILRMTER